MNQRTETRVTLLKILRPFPLSFVDQQCLYTVTYCFFFCVSLIKKTEKQTGSITMVYEVKGHTIGRGITRGQGMGGGGEVARVMPFPVI